MLAQKTLLRIGLWLVSAVGLAAQSGEVKLVGSDLLGASFKRAVQQFAEQNEIAVPVDLAGTRLGREGLRSSVSTVAILSARDGEAIKEAGWVALPFAYCTLVVVAPRGLPVNQLDFSQLSAIYGSSEASTQLRWGEFGALGEWRGRTILPKIVGPKVSIAHDLMRYTILRTPTFKSTVEELPTTAQVLAKLKTNDGALGILPNLPADNPELKVLLLTRDTGGVAFGPTPENVHTGDYPVRLPLYLVFQRAEAPNLSRVLKFLLSEDTAEALKVDGIVPLPRSVRNQEVFDLETLR